MSNPHIIYVDIYITVNIYIYIYIYSVSKINISVMGTCNKTPKKLATSIVVIIQIAHTGCIILAYTKYSIILLIINLVKLL